MTVRTVPLALLLLSLCCGMLAGCADRHVAAASSATLAGAGAGKVTSSPPDDYIIGAGDSLSVFVYRNPDLSEAGVSVRPDGRISVPLIEDITAAGKTPTRLARDIEARLKKYIQDPNVTVIVRSFIGPPDRQVRVIGEATDPQ